MITKVFTNGSTGDEREIMISVDDNGAEFFFYEYYNHQIEWLTEQEENGNIDNLSEDEKANNGFYFILKDDWISRKDQWDNHMYQKRWFTKEMFSFLNEQLI